MNTRTFKTIDVLEVWTGKQLPGFEEGFHGVMDFFYPGIMTVGCAAMLEPCRKLLEIQLPEEVKKITFYGMTPANAEAMVEEALSTLPETITLVSNPNSQTPMDEINAIRKINPNAKIIPVQIWEHQEGRSTHS
jgi:hypothetical protein